MKLKVNFSAVIIVDLDVVNMSKEDVDIALKEIKEEFLEEPVPGIAADIEYNVVEITEEKEQAQ